MCATDCAPSTSTRAPWRWAISTISRAGVTVPSAFETWVKDTMRVRGPEQLFVFFEDHLAAIVDRRDAQPRALLRAQLLPRHDVGVVLEPGDDDLVALLDVAAAPALGDEVDALGGAAHEDDLARRAAFRKRRTFSRAPS